MNKLYLSYLPRGEDIEYFLNKNYDKFNIVKGFFLRDDKNKAEILRNRLPAFLEFLSKETDRIYEFIAEKNGLDKSERTINTIKKIIGNLRQKRKDLPKFEKQITATQIRKHYNYFLDVYQDVEYSNRIFQETHAVKLAMERVYVNYDFAREKVNYFFKRFVEDLIDEVKDFETLESAKILFEALVGYSKLFVKKN